MHVGQVALSGWESWMGGRQDESGGMQSIPDPSAKCRVGHIPCTDTIILQRVNHFMICRSFSI